MEIVLKIKKQNFEKVKNIILKDDTVSRASVTFKESKSLGLKDDWYYCYISGLDEACKKVMELTKGLTENINKKEEEEVISKIKKEEEEAMAGFGGIFG
jgi:alpha-D-ribose 1-methylphosphonate 5-triphosphate synthase subunit PhnG